MLTAQGVRHGVISVRPSAAATADAAPTLPAAKPQKAAHHYATQKGDLFYAYEAPFAPLAGSLSISPSFSRLRTPVLCPVGYLVCLVGLLAPSSSMHSYRLSSSAGLPTQSQPLSASWFVDCWHRHRTRASTARSSLVPLLDWPVSRSLPQLHPSRDIYTIVCCSCYSILADFRSTARVTQTLEHWHRIALSMPIQPLRRVWHRWHSLPPMPAFPDRPRPLHPIRCLDPCSRPMSSTVSVTAVLPVAGGPQRCRTHRAK